MAASSLRQHIERSHGIVLPNIRGVDIGGGGPETYKVLFPRIFEVSGMPGRVLPRNGKHSGDIEVIFHVLKLEVEGDHHSGGAGTSSTV